VHSEIRGAPKPEAAIRRLGFRGATKRILSQ
jgi:hypothetical protein